MSLNAAFAAFPELETPRLLLREPRPEDAAALFAVFSDEEVVRYYGVLPHRSVDESAALIRRHGEWYAAQRAIRWAITRWGEDVFLGSCGFHRFDRESRRAELGYEVGRAHWRQGIAGEAVGALLAFGFEQMGLHRIEAAVDGDNEPSKRLLLKLGFTYEGRLRQRFWFNDRYWDEHYFGLLREDYDRLRATSPPGDPPGTP